MYSVHRNHPGSLEASCVWVSPRRQQGISNTANASNVKPKGHNDEKSEGYTSYIF